MRRRISVRDFRVDDNGDEEEVAQVATGQVEVKLRAVRQFCPVKNMHLAVYFELDRFSPLSLQELGLTLEPNHTLANVRSDLLTYEVYAGNYEKIAKKLGIDERGLKDMFEEVAGSSRGIHPQA